MFVVFEGPEGSGKTTQIQLTAKWLRERGHNVVVTREPGGTHISEHIRSIIVDCDHCDMNPRTELLLYSAARAQHVEQVIRPALNRGDIVLCDRFYHSTYAYQGYGRGLDLDELANITRYATNGLTPDIVIFLMIDVEEGLARKGDDTNRLDQESLDFHKRILRGYLDLPLHYRDANWISINASQSAIDVQNYIQYWISNESL